MAQTDSIADMLTRLRNASRARHPYTDVPASKLKREVCRVLQETRYIKRYDLLDDKKQGVLRMYLRYTPERDAVITGLKRVSRPGRRRYVSADRLPKVVGGMGRAIMSTSRGVLTDEQCREARVGGEVLCYVW